MSALNTFKQNLKNKKYSNVTAARRAIGKIKDISDAERAAGYKAVDKHFGVESKPAKPAKKAATKKAAAKKAPAKKAPSKIDVAKKALAKKKAGKSERGQVTVTKTSGKSKSSVGPGKGRMKKKAPTKKASVKKAKSKAAALPPAVEEKRQATNDAVEKTEILERVLKEARTTSEAFPNVDFKPLVEEARDGLLSVVKSMQTLTADLADAQAHTEQPAQPSPEPAIRAPGNGAAQPSEAASSGPLPGLPANLPGMPTSQ